LRDTKQVALNHTTHNYHLCKHNGFGTVLTQVVTAGSGESSKVTA